VQQQSIAISVHGRAEDEQTSVRRQKHTRTVSVPGENSTEQSIEPKESDEPEEPVESDVEPDEPVESEEPDELQPEEAPGESAVQMKERGAVQGVHARADVDGKLSVSFEYQGKHYNYSQLVPHSVYEAGAKVYFGGELLEASPTRTYRLWDEGKRAALTWHVDGTVEGLFEDTGRVMEITPVSRSQDVSLLEGYSGVHPPHVIQWIPALFEKSNEQSRIASGGSDLIALAGNSSSSGVWSGQEWYPGCYRGDSRRHKVIIAFASDSASLSQEGGSTSRLQSKLNSIVNQASFVFENQMNFELKLGRLDMARSSNEWQGGCGCGDGSCMTSEKLSTLRKSNCVVAILQIRIICQFSTNLFNLFIDWFQKSIYCVVNYR